MTPEQTLTSVVTVNFNGREHLAALLPALMQQSYTPVEILVVDNGSTDGSADFVRESFPEIRLLSLGENLGFAAANNLGIRQSRGRLVALVNNDTVPDRHWLTSLVHGIEASPDIAAVGSKILFLEPFVPVTLRADAVVPAAEGMSADWRELGALVDERSGFLETRYQKPIFHRGFFGGERVEKRRVRWSGPTATVFLPVPSREKGGTLRLIVSGGDVHRRRRLSVGVGTMGLADLELAPGFHVYDVPVPTHVVAAEAFDVINNAGSRLSSTGAAGDRGIAEVDRGQFDVAEDIEAFCGAAVLLRRSALDQVGLFDADFFMYYEDTDLSWRLRDAGFRLRYEPQSVIRHVHAATSVEWSPMFKFYTARNKVLMIAKNGSLASLGRAYGAELLRTAWILPSWLARGGRGARAALTDFVTHLRVQCSLVWQVPRTFLKRRRALAR